MAHLGVLLLLLRVLNGSRWDLAQADEIVLKLH